MNIKGIQTTLKYLKIRSHTQAAKEYKGADSLVFVFFEPLSRCLDFDEVEFFWHVIELIK